MTEEKTLIRAEQGRVIIQMETTSDPVTHEGLTFLLRSIAAFLMAVDMGRFWPHFTGEWGRFISEMYDDFNEIDRLRGTTR